MLLLTPRWKTDHEVMADIVVQYTELLRTSSYDLWVRLRELLKIQGIDPNGTVMVELFQGGPDHEDGQLISAQGRVYSFTLFYDQAVEDGALSAELRNWTDITESWRLGLLAARTAEAFAWQSRGIG